MTGRALGMPEKATVMLKICRFRAPFNVRHTNLQTANMKQRMFDFIFQYLPSCPWFRLFDVLRAETTEGVTEHPIFSF